MHLKLDQSITALLVLFLDPLNHDQAGEVMRTWDDSCWQIFKLAVLRNGLGPYLHYNLQNLSLYDRIPSYVRTWLEDQAELNRLRIDRLYTIAAGLFREFHQHGIKVMPLKGILLSACLYAQPGLRPMADIDVLIHPQDADEACSLLESQNYRQLKPSGEKHDYELRFVNLQRDHIVTRQGEHPDNPCRIEIHTKLQRRLWGDILTVDMTQQLWESSQIEKLLGEQVWMPSLHDHFQYLAHHATIHFFLYAGRMMQWLDLAELSHTVKDQTDWPNPNYLFPAIQMAARAFPSKFDKSLVTALAPHAHPRLRRWSAEVPLDHRCGLDMRTAPTADNLLTWYWKSWKPHPWRLVLGYGDIPLYNAWLLHAFTILRRLITKSG